MTAEPEATIAAVRCLQLKEVPIVTIVKISLSIVGIVVIIIAAILVGVVKIFPKYADGEAWAMVQNQYPTYQLLAEPEYMLEGRWRIMAEDPSGNNWEISVYEQTNTIQAKEMLFQVPAPGSSPFGVTFWLLIGNLILLAANIIFALLNWTRRRRMEAARTRA